MILSEDERIPTHTLISYKVSKFTGVIPEIPISE